MCVCVCVCGENVGGKSKKIFLKTVQCSETETQLE